MKTLTEKQTDTLVAISILTAKTGYPPSIRDLSRCFGISWQAISIRNKGLRKKQYLIYSESFRWCGTILTYTGHEAVAIAMIEAEYAIDAGGRLQKYKKVE